MGKKIDFALAVLNGAVGDYLARTGNELATPMQLFKRGAPVSLDRTSLARAYPNATSRVVVLVHGIMCTEAIWDFSGGGDYGSKLETDRGFTPLYVRYNSGLTIAGNGAALAELLETLIEAFPRPIDEILFLGYSMGGLVLRSACHVASAENLRWLKLVRRAIYVGTPHLGAPLERAGRVLAKVLHAIDDPYTRLIGQLADMRSDGVKDLGDADLRHEDRQARRVRPALGDARHPVPLLPQIDHYLVAGSITSDPFLADIFGDTVVPVASATNHRNVQGIAQGHIQIVRGVTHMDLAHHADVYEHVLSWIPQKETT